MAKAVLNECSAPLNFRAPRRRKQSLSLSVLFFLLFVFQYICTGTLHTLCSRFKSVNRSRFPLHWLSFSCWTFQLYLLLYVVSEATRSSFRGCKYQNFSGGAPSDPPSLTVCYDENPEKCNNNTCPLLILKSSRLPPLDENPERNPANP